MSGLTEQQPFSLQARIRKTPGLPLRLTFIIAGLLLSVMPLLTGCGGDPSVTVAPGGGSTPPVGVTASLAWSTVQDPSVTVYFVHYGRQSPNQSGSCEYERSVHVTSPSVTVEDLDPNTTYYFAVSAYNGLLSACSNEVSTVTPPASA